LAAVIFPDQVAGFLPMEKSWLRTIARMVDTVNEEENIG